MYVHTIGTPRQKMTVPTETRITLADHHANANETAAQQAASTGSRRRLFANPLNM